MMVEGSPRIMAVATQGVQSGASIGSPKEQDDRKDRDHTEQGVNCLKSERPCFIPVKQASTDVQLSRWKKLRTTVQLGGAVSQVHKKHCLKREDSFIKRFSARLPPPVASEIPIHPRHWRRCTTSTVLNPYESLLFWWLWVLTACVLYNAWTLIVRQAFPELQESLSPLWHTADGCSDLVFLIDVVVQFRTGYLEQGIMVRDGLQLARHYVTSKAFFLDIVALTPLDLAQVWIGPFPLLRLPRFLKVQRTYHFYYIVESRTAYPNLWRVVNLVHVLLLLAHWFGCFYYMLSELENFEGSWSYPRPEKEYSTLTRKYLGSVYWSTLTLTTIGDLATPATNLQYLFTIISYLIGVFIFATIVGQVGNVITNRNASRLEFERLLDGAKLYMRHHKVPREMQRRVQRWYDYSWSRGRMQGGGDINSALGILPDKLKTELALHVNLKTLKKVTIFQECQPEFLYDLVLKMKAYIFTPGDLICRKGEVAREMFIIADGILEVINENGLILTQMKAGDFFGEIGILNLDGFNRRTADVRSVGYSELFSLSREDVLMAMKDYPDAQEILRSMGRKRLMEARVKSPGKDDDGGKKPEKPSSRLIGNRSAKGIADHKITGEHSVFKKMKDNLFSSQLKAATTEKSDAATKDACAELRKDASPKKWPPAHASNFHNTDKKLNTTLNANSGLNSSQITEVTSSSDLGSSTNSVYSSSNILSKSRRTSMEPSKNPSYSSQAGPVSQRNSTSQDIDYKENKFSNKRPNAWRRFSDVVASFGRDKEDFRKEAFQNLRRESKPTALGACFVSGQDTRFYSNDSRMGVKNWQRMYSDVEHPEEEDTVALVDYDRTPGELDFSYKPNSPKAELEERCDPKCSPSTDVSRGSQVLIPVLSGKVVCGSRRSKKTSQRNLVRRSRQRSRKKTNKVTSPRATQTPATEVNTEEGKDAREHESKPTDLKTEENMDPMKLALHRYFQNDHVPTEECDASHAEREAATGDIDQKIGLSSFDGSINDFLTKVAENVKFAMKSYVQMEKEGGLWLRILELEEQIKQRDEVITQLKWEAEQIVSDEEENVEDENIRANDNTSVFATNNDGKRTIDQGTPCILKSDVTERHVQFSQTLSQDDVSKPVLLPDIVEYMESSIEDPCADLEEDDLWRVEFPDNDIPLKTTPISWKRPKMRRHSSVEVGSETPMHLLHFVSGAPRTQHLLPTHPEETTRLTARRYSESQTEAEGEVPNTQSFAARVRKVFQKIKANAEIKVATGPDDSRNTSSTIVRNLCRSSKRLSDGGLVIGGHEETTREEKQRRYSDTLLRSTNAPSEYSAATSSAETAITKARRISSEGNIGRTGFRTLPTITEDDFIKKLMSSSFDSTFDDGCQDLATPTNETQTSCVVELPQDAVLQNTNSDYNENSPCPKQR